MKNKTISLFIVFSFSACILCAPVHIFFQNFSKSSLSFKSSNIKGIAKDIVFSADKIIPLEDFTQNIKTPKKKTFDFSAFPAVFSKAAKQKFSAGENSEKFLLKKTVGFSTGFHFNNFCRHRLRTCADNNDAGILFIFFMLIYIGMLRTVVYFNNKNMIFAANEKPLFA